MTSTINRNVIEKEFSQVVVNETVIRNFVKSSSQLGLSKKRASFFWYFLRHFLSSSECPEESLVLSGKRWHAAQLRAAPCSFQQNLETFSRDDLFIITEEPKGYNQTGPTAMTLEHWFPILDLLGELEQANNTLSHCPTEHRYQPSLDTS